MKSLPEGNARWQLMEALFDECERLGKAWSVGCTDDSLTVYVHTREDAEKIPTEFRGYPVQTLVPPDSPEDDQ